jgi:signal transduction histidine kinase
LPAPWPPVSLGPSSGELEAIAAETRRQERAQAAPPVLAALLLAAAAAAALFALRRRERFEQRRDAFVCAVTHELKTPIANISLYAETLRDHGSDDVANVPRFADVILGEAERLRHRVQQVLDIATGRSCVPDARATFDPAPVVRAVCADYAARGARIDVSADSAAGLARGAEMLFRRALEGVLDNAVKFGGGSVGVALGRENGHVRVAVTDTGPGIPRADHERVFDPFVRLPEAHARALPGTGLGLTLVRRCVEDCGGSVRVRDAAGGGALVELRLPAAGA